MDSKGYNFIGVINHENVDVVLYDGKDFDRLRDILDEDKHVYIVDKEVFKMDNNGDFGCIRSYKGDVLDNLCFNVTYFQINVFNNSFIYIDKKVLNLKDDLIQEVVNEDLLVSYFIFFNSIIYFENREND